MMRPYADPRYCVKCSSTKPLADFYIKGRTLQGRPRYDAFCKVCRKAQVRAYCKKNPLVVRARKKLWQATRGKFVCRERHLRRTYNTSQMAYDLQFQGQNGVCAICGRLPAEGEYRFAFDHDHETGLTRGVLCSACNGGLGCFRDRPDLLRSALTYLAAWSIQHKGQVA